MILVVGYLELHGIIHGRKTKISHCRRGLVVTLFNTDRNGIPPGRKPGAYAKLEADYFVRIFGWNYKSWRPHGLRESLGEAEQHSRTIEGSRSVAQCPKAWFEVVPPFFSRDFEGQVQLDDFASLYASISVAQGFFDEEPGDGLTRRNTGDLENLGANQAPVALK